MPTTTAPPILIWSPGGGTPIGPVSNPPVYSQAGITPLIQGQAYVDVVFGSIQTDNNWVLVECDVVNTADGSPLNIWPGIITNKTTAGFRVWLNGLPDSANYYLHWAVSGINIAPTPATSYQFTGPSSGAFSTASTFTVRLPPSTTLSSPVTVTLSDGGVGGTFIPSSVVLSSGSASATFTYIPTHYGAITLSVTNSGTLSDPANIAFTCVASFYDLTGPSSGAVGVASTNFTVALASGGVVIGTVTVTPGSGGGGGTFTPATVALTTGAPSATFTYTPSSVGAKTISVTNNGGLTDPGNITYTATAPFSPLSIAGCKLWLKADSLALTDGATVVLWSDSSGNGNDFTNLGTPLYKTGIVNGNPVVRFDGATQLVRNITASIVPTNSTNYTVLVVAKAASTSAGDHEMFATGSAGGAFYVRRTGADAAHIHFNGSGYPTAHEVGGIVAGAWNVFTADWNGSNIHLWRNGTLKDTTVATTMGNAGTVNSIAADAPDSYVNLWDGDMAEVLVYNSSLSMTDRQNVEGYLKTKYATP